MKSIALFSTKCLLFISTLFIIPFSHSFAQHNNFFEVTGIIKNTDTKKIVGQTSVRVEGTNIGTISNTDGEFLLKVPNTYSEANIEVTHLGFISRTISLNKNTGKPYEIFLSPVVQNLDEIQLITYTNAGELVQKLFEKRAENYSKDRNLLTSFYRETIKKRRKNVSLSEAVVNLYKQPYTTERTDFLKLVKSRKDTDYQKLDTIALKLQGGPYNTLYVDVVKYPEYIFDMPNITNYNFSFGQSTEINDQLVYVIDFTQKEGIIAPLYYGKLFINSETFALVRAIYSLNITDKKEAMAYFIKKKPSDVKLEPLRVNYRVDYSELNGQWYYNYSKADLSFRIKRKRKLFNSVYSLAMEMAVTNRNSIQEDTQWNRKDRFKESIVLADEASGFSDPEFWGSYNVIEPEKSIESAIEKIQKKLEKLN